MLVRYVFKSVELVPLNTGFLFRGEHWETRSYRWKNDSIPMSQKERQNSFSSYYAQSSVDIAAAKREVHLTPESLLYVANDLDNNHLLRSAQYLHRELPVRVAHRIMGFRTLPFIIGCHPTILYVHDMYLDAFKRLTGTAPVRNFTDEQEFSNVLNSLLDDHSEVIGLLARGFKECRHRIKDSIMIKTFLDQTLTSRLGIRMLAEHHLALRDSRPHHVGIVNKRMSLTDVVKKQIEIVSGMFQLQYCATPKVIIAGQTNLVFPYIRMPLEYILVELLKNAFRATIESRSHNPNLLPPIHITLASDKTDFWIRISDHAGGIPRELEHMVWDYHMSTPSLANVEAGWEGTACQDNMKSSLGNDPNVLPPPTNSGGSLDPHIVVSREAVEEDIALPKPPHDFVHAPPVDGRQGFFSGLTQHQVTPSIHGFGFGLPICRAYARYLGGDLQLYTIRSIGSDCYLRLRHIDGKADSFRI